MSIYKFDLTIYTLQFYFAGWESCRSRLLRGSSRQAWGALLFTSQTKWANRILTEVAIVEVILSSLLILRIEIKSTNHILVIQAVIVTLTLTNVTSSVPTTLMIRSLLRNRPLTTYLAWTGVAAIFLLHQCGIAAEEADDSLNKKKTTAIVPSLHCKTYLISCVCALVLHRTAVFI